MTFSVPVRILNSFCNFELAIKGADSVEDARGMARSAAADISAVTGRHVVLTGDPQEIGG